MLDKRLKMIYDMMPDGVVCDIGTDHCKLCVYAVESGKAPFAYGTDLREGPLDAARRLVNAHSLKDKITLIRSDGFREIPGFVFEKTDVFVAAGMGGELIASFLIERDIEKPMVLQPMTGEDELCEFLHRKGYNIIERRFCDDGNHVYNAFYVKYDGVQRENDYFAGVVRSDAFYKYLHKEIERIKFSLYCLNHAEKPDRSRIPALEDKLEKFTNEYNMRETAQ